MNYRNQMRLACLAAALLAACGPDDNSGPCKDDLNAGDLVITEVFADYAAPTGGTGTDDGKEWFEIYNNADRPISLQGVTITSSKADGSDAKSHTMADITLAPGQFFTLGNSTSDLVPAYVDYGYSADLGDLNNSTGGKLALKCGDSEIDSAQYELVKSGHSRQLSNAGPPDYTTNDDLANWCEAKDTEFEPNNFGTPGADNDCSPVIAGACSDNNGMRAVVTPAVGELVITEVMPKPTAVGAAAGQWIEVKALASVDLNGLSLDRANDTAGPSVLSSASCMHLDAGQYAVFARSIVSTENGGLTAIAELPFSINPTTTVPDVQIVLGTTVIDAVSWMTSTSGASRSLDPDFATATSNDDQANWCDGTTVYNTVGTAMDRGTPGADNAQCAAVAPAGQCYDGGSLRAIVKPAANALVINEFLANPAGTATGVDAAQEWFEITNTSGTAFDLNDLIVQGSGAATSKVQASDCKSVAPGGYALLAHNTDAGINGGLPAVDATFPTNIALGNTSGRIQILDGTTVLDVITWTSGTAAPDGKSMQLDPAMTNATANDTPPTNYCAGLVMYGTAANLGTPKAVNACM
jgi:hypothetical protein